MPPVLKATLPIAAAEPITHPTTQLASPYRPSWLHFVFILLAGLLARTPFYLAFKPMWSGDSGMYTVPYFLWSTHKFGPGERTPVYPLFLGLAQWLCRVPASPTLSFKAAYLAIYMQSALNIGATCLLLYTLGKLNVRRNIALASAVFVATIPALCVMEVNILNLSIGFAVLVLCTSIFATLIKRIRDGSPIVIISLVCGFIFAFAVLLRPENMVFSVVLVTILLGIWVPSKIRGVATSHEDRIPAAVFLIFISAAIPILAWMTWNYVGIGEFRITTLMGWNRTKTVYNLFDKVDKEDQLFGQIMTASFLQRNRNGLVVRDHIWQARPNLEKYYYYLPIVDPTETASAFHLKVDSVFEDVLGMKTRIPCVPGEFCTAVVRQRVNIGDYAGRVSFKLIKRFPRTYLNNVLGNFVSDTFDFRYAETTPAIEDYRATTVDGSDPVRPGFEPVAKFLSRSIDAEAPLLLGFYIVTLGFVIFAPLTLLLKSGELPIEDIIVTSLALATVGTFIAMCILSGYNKEYSIPHLGIMVICTAYAVENWSRIAGTVGFTSTRGAAQKLRN